MVWKIIAACVICYLLGGLNFAIICSKLFKSEDVREKGSGSAGLTNYARNYGGKSTLLVIVGDMGKCFLAVYLTRWVFRDSTLGGYAIADMAKFLAGLFVMLGHMFPPYFGFKGGKGVLTTAALILAFDWRVFLIGISIFIIIVLVTRYVSLGSIVAVFSVIPLIWIFFRADPLVIYYAVTQTIIWLIVCFMHRANIKRLLSGTETKFSLARKK